MTTASGHCARVWPGCRILQRDIHAQAPTGPRRGQLRFARGVGCAGHLRRRAVPGAQPGLDPRGLVDLARQLRPPARAGPAWPAMARTSARRTGAQAAPPAAIAAATPPGARRAALRGVVGGLEGIRHHDHAVQRPAGVRQQRGLQRGFDVGSPAAAAHRRRRGRRTRSTAARPASGGRRLPHFAQRLVGRGAGMLSERSISTSHRAGCAGPARPRRAARPRSPPPQPVAAPAPTRCEPPASCDLRPQTPRLPRQGGHFHSSTSSAASRGRDRSRSTPVVSVFDAGAATAGGADAATWLAVGLRSTSAMASSNGTSNSCSNIRFSSNGVSGPAAAANAESPGISDRLGRPGPGDDQASSPAASSTVSPGRGGNCAAVHRRDGSRSTRCEGAPCRATMTAPRPALRRSGRRARARPARLPGDPCRRSRAPHPRGPRRRPLPAAPDARAAYQQRLRAARIDGNAPRAQGGQRQFEGVVLGQRIAGLQPGAQFNGARHREDGEPTRPHPGAASSGPAHRLRWTAAAPATRPPVPPLCSLTSTSIRSGSSAWRRADRRSRPTLRVPPATRTTRSGRRPAGIVEQRRVRAVGDQPVQAVGPSSAAAGGAVGSPRPAPAADWRRRPHPGAPRSRHGSDSVRTVISRRGQLIELCARPAPALPGKAHLGAGPGVAGAHAQRVVDPQGDRRIALRQLRAGQRDAQQRRQQRAAPPGWDRAAGARLRSPGWRGGAYHSARRDTRSTRRCRPPRCSQRISGSSSSAQPPGEAQLSNWRGPAADATQQRLLPRRRCPSG